MRLVVAWLSLSTPWRLVSAPRTAAWRSPGGLGLAPPPQAVRSVRGSRLPLVGSVGERSSS